MLKNHPQGLRYAIWVNTFECFAFYSMAAVLLLFLPSKLGLSGETAGIIYSIFYFAIFILLFVGGRIADKTRNYKGSICFGLVLMTAGYFIIAASTPILANRTELFLTAVCLGLFLIALGKGLFKGNLQAVVGQMYDDPNYSKLRDAGFMWFGMFVAVGGVFASAATIGIKNCWGETNQFYFYFVFVVSFLAAAVSLTVYLLNRKQFPAPAEAVQKEKTDRKDARQRLYAIFAVFAVLNLFYFAFNQKECALSYFVRDFVNLDAINIDFGFTAIRGAAVFRAINPFFFIILTPIVLWLLGVMRQKGKEFSTLRKMAMGMGIAASAYVFILVVSAFLPTKAALSAMSTDEIELMKITPWAIVGCHFILTVSELLIAPLLISFVSKISPTNCQGTMQGLCLLASAISNSLLFLGLKLYVRIPIWATWSLFAAVCLLAMFIMLLILKWAEGIGK